MDSNAIEIYESKPYWKLPENIGPEQIRYFDGTAYYRNLQANMDWDAGVSQLQERKGYPDNVFGTRVTPQNFALNESTIASVPTSTISINDNEVGVILSSGDTYWNFRLDNIRYVVEVDGKPQPDWYTEDQYETKLKGIINLSDRRVYTVTKQSRRYGTTVNIPPPLNGLTLRKADGSATFPSVLISGKWRYLMTNAEFDTLSYVDKTGAYYERLTTAKQAIDDALTTVSKTFDDNYIEAPDSRQYVAQSFDVLGNTEIVKQGFTMDGKSYPYVIKEGKAYIEPNLFEQINFVTNSVDRAYTSSYALISNDQRSGAFSSFRRPDIAVLPGFNGVEIAPTDGQRRTIEVRGLDGFLRTTDVVGKRVGGTPVYEFSDVAVGAIIKYKGADNRFLASLDFLEESDGAISQVLPFSVESLDASKAHLGVTQQADEQVRTVIAAAVLGGLGLLGVIAGIVRIVYLMRRRSK